MSLQVWLPLTGDLHNQGLNPMTFTNENTSNIVIDDAGKIGKCYKRTTKNTAGRIISNSNINLNGDLSMCCWANVIETPEDSANGLISNHSHTNKTGFGITVKQVSTTDYRICCSTGNGSDRTYHTYYGTSNIKGAWHHLALTYNNTTHVFQLWVDGKVEKTQSYTNASQNDKILLFDWSTTNNSTSYRPACMLNDVRIYDHCLSPKEVEEIAKGLVLHYPLNNYWLVENILTNSSGYQGTSAWSGLVTASNENGHAYLIAKRTNTTSTSRTFCTHTVITSLVSSWSPGDKFTISGYYKIPSSETYEVGGNMFIRWTLSSGTSDTGFTTATGTSLVKDTWIRFENTYSVPNNYAGGAVNFYLSAFAQGLSTVYWRDIKLEKGDRATPWCPAKTDTLYTALGYGGTTIYDSSGYSNNGTIVGSLTAAAPSPRYDVATDFSSGSIKGPTFNYCNQKNITISFWAYSTDWSATSSSARNVFTNYTTNNGIRIYRSADAHRLRLQYGTILLADGTVGNTNVYFHSSTVLPANSWQHFVVTLDSSSDRTIAKTYHNGQLYTSNDLQTLFNHTYTSNFTLYAPEPSEGKIVDFRVYTTALTADQVKELYNTSMSIDSSGNIHARELVEL